MNTPSPWQLLKEYLAYNGYRKISRRTYRLPSGRIADFDIKIEKDGAHVLALTPDRQVILIRQYRPGPNLVTLELPGGGIDKGKTPQVAAEHELSEETGYTGNFTFIGTSIKDAWSDHNKYNFVATDCKLTQAQKLGPNEFIEVVLMPLKDFRAELKAGNIADMDTAYLGLDYLELL